LADDLQAFTDMNYEKGFQTFHSCVWEHLIKVQQKPARLFGLRYLDYLQAEHRGLASEPAPKPESTEERSVRTELDRIYQEYYGNRMARARV
jgi:hypothetical protein